MSARPRNEQGSSEIHRHSPSIIDRLHFPESFRRAPTREFRSEGCFPAQPPAAKAAQHKSENDGPKNHGGR